MAARCSRAESRTAHSLIISDVLEPSKISSSDLPESCVLNPDRDMFAFQESHKKLIRQGNVKCGLCGKTFKNHHYADKHMDLKHGDQLQANYTTSLTSTSCLADYCDVLGCDSAISSNTLKPCRQDEMTRRKHRCRAVFDHCFPAEADLRLHDRFTHAFCDRLTCEQGNKRPFQPLGTHVGAEETEGTSSARVVVLILLFVGLTIFYGIMGHLKHEASTRRDLRPLASRERSRPILARVATFFTKRRRLVD
jgi:hypothetical protein